VLGSIAANPNPKSHVRSDRSHNRRARGRGAPALEHFSQGRLSGALRDKAKRARARGAQDTAPDAPTLAHDPAKWTPVRGKDLAQQGDSEIRVSLTGSRLARGSQRAPPQYNGEGEQKRHREPLLSGLNDVLEPVRKDQRRRPLRSLHKETPGGPGARWKAGGMGVSRGAFEFGI
jgi:hypothetical protein